MGESMRDRMPSTVRSVADFRRERRQPARLHVFKPVHKLALGVGVGSVLGICVFAVTAFHVLLQPQDAPPIQLLSHYFYGYAPTWPGAFVGLFWGGFTGFVAGWFVGFVHNLVTATMVFIFKAKGEMAQMRNFLDHI
jgi:hypothetical protein